MAADPAGLAQALRAAFGWRGPIAVEPGPRGATAHVWQVDAAGSRYALKTSTTAPSPAALAAEVAFVGHARAAGIAAPTLHADAAGRFVHPGPGGTWLRLYDCVDVRPVDLAHPATPAAVGELLARLHRGASPALAEPDGTPPDAWYAQPPRASDFEPLMATGAWWVPRLAERGDTLEALVQVAQPADPARLVLCHRDLHPGNVVLDATGRLVVLDQDDLGPADPTHELARALFDWWSDPEPDLGRMRSMHAAYVAAGGPGRPRAPRDFTMLVSSRLNFLLRQLLVAADLGADPGDRAWAEQEIDESLRIMPTLPQIGRVLAAIAG